MDRQPTRRALYAPVLAVLLLGGGCATKSSTYAKPLAGSNFAATPLAACRHLTVAPFAMPSASKHQEVGALFASDVATRLANSFGPTFDSVAQGAKPRGLEGECLLGGTISKYRRGNGWARSLLPLVAGPAGYVAGTLFTTSLEGSIEVRDGATGRSLLQAPFDRLAMLGGKSMKGMSSETTARVANTVAQARGWQPPAGNEVPGGSKQ